jgi:hypothetical protein
MAEEEKKSPPYARYAFKNAYNLSLLAGVGAMSAITGNVWLAAVGAGVEALWMLFAPDSRLLRRLWFDKVHSQALSTEEEKSRAELLASLPKAESERVRAVFAKREQILRLCEENQAMTGDMLRPELQKLDSLNQSFVDLVSSTRRQEQYLRSVDLDRLESEIRWNEMTSSDAAEEETRKLAKQNLAILLKRKDKLSEIKQFVTQAQGQMSLIENTFQLLADQIVTMRSPKELSGQLDELIDGVEAVRSTARETDALLEAAR